MAVVAGDSADPRAIANDLMQLQAIAQRMGLQLGQLSAAGQRTASASSMDSHQGFHPGGGSGYENLAAGAVVGASLSHQDFRKKPIGSIYNEVLNNTLQQKLANAKIEKKIGLSYLLRAESGELYHQRAVFNPLTSRYARSGYELSDVYREVGKTDVYRQGKWRSQPISVPIAGYYAKLVSGPTIGYKAKKLLTKTWQAVAGDDSDQAKMNRKLMKFVAGMEGIRTLGRMLDKRPDESMTDVILESGGSFARSMVQMRIASHIAEHGVGWKAGWTRGRYAVRSVMSQSAFGPGSTSTIGRTAGTVARTAGGIAGGVAMAGGIAAGVLAAERLFQIGGDIWDGYKEDARSQKQLKSFAKSVGMDEKTMKLSASSLEAFNKAVAVGAFGHEFDEDGNRKERGFWSQFWELSANHTEAMQKEKQWRFEEAAKAHDSALKAGMLMDWAKAMDETNKAKELIVAKEAFPYFWREPEKYLRAMESARIANRNWARSQSALADDRTGD